MNWETAGRRFARFATDVSVRYPWTWRLLRPLVRFEFDRLAPGWDARRSTEPSPYEAALDQIDAPRRALDLGTGTGRYAIEIARRFLEADVVGADLSEQMLGEAWSNLPDDLRDRVRFERADASKLPYEEGEFDFVGLGNMIPFFDELERVTAPGGSLMIAFSQGASTPIYVPFDRLRSELGARGFTDFAEISAGPGTALVARKQKPA